MGLYIREWGDPLSTDAARGGPKGADIALRLATAPGAPGRAPLPEISLLWFPS